MPRKDSHILIVEDDVEVAGLLRYHLMLNNYKCHIVNTVKEHWRSWILTKLT